MSPAKIAAILGSIFLSLLLAAFAWDSSTMLAHAYDEVNSVDKEISRQEHRYLESLKGLTPNVEISNLISSYEAAQSPTERSERFETLNSEVNKQIVTSLDPTNPIKRPLLDELVGALNRRKIARAELTARADRYNQLSQGFRGRIARSFLSLPIEWGR